MISTPNWLRLVLLCGTVFTAICGCDDEPLGSWGVDAGHDAQMDAQADDDAGN